MDLHLKLSRLPCKTNTQADFPFLSIVAQLSKRSVYQLLIVLEIESFIFFSLAISKSHCHMYLFDSITFSLRLTIISTKVNCDLFT